MATIEQNLAAILAARYGKDVRQSIHDSIEQCYEDAIELNNMNVAENAAETAVAAAAAASASAQQLLAGTASPAGTYANLAALIAANPDHSKIYITLDDGKWCYHNGFAFVEGGVYQNVSYHELISETALKADAMASGSPKGQYATLVALQSAFPTGDTGAYLVEADSRLYFWDSVTSAWIDGGEYNVAHASKVAITDAGGYYATDTVEAALQEAGPLLALKPVAVNVMEAYGADNTGATDTTAAFTAAFAALDASVGGTILVPSGLYDIAVGGRIEVNGKNNIILEGELYSKLYNSTKCGTTGDMLVFVDCDNILIRGFEIGCPSSNPNTFDNALCFLGCTNVVVEDCRFTLTSNKHIHIGGISDNITIRNCTFEEAHFNSSPRLTTAIFGSIFLHYENETNTHTTNVRIYNNVFRDIPAFGVSVYNSESHVSAAKANAITDVWVHHNTFTNVCYPVATRGKRIFFEDNICVNCGYVNIKDYYVWNATLSKYFSLFRQAEGQTADANNTIPAFSGPLVHSLGAQHCKINGNRFINCLQYQVNADNPITNVSLLNGRLSKHCEFSCNVIDDEASTAYPNAYPIWYGNAGEATNFNKVIGNTFIANSGVTPLKQMIRFDVAANTVSGNRLYNAANTLLYNGITDERVIIFQNSLYYELDINAGTLAVTGVAKTIGTDF